MTPLSVVIIKEGEHAGKAGVVEKVSKGAVVVDLDADHSRVTVKPDQLTLIRAHGG